MKAGSSSANRMVWTSCLGIMFLLAGVPAGAQTPDAACIADSLYLISPDEIDLRLQTQGRLGMVLSWRDLDLSQSTCFALEATGGADFEASVEGGYGGLVDRSFRFTNAITNGIIGTDGPEKVLFNWKSDGPSFYGSVGGVLNLANNGGLWRFNQASGTWGQLNNGLSMTWLMPILSMTAIRHRRSCRFPAPRT